MPAMRKSPKTSNSRGWSQRVTRTSHALDLRPGVFLGSSALRRAARIVQEGVSQ